jgi:hypothetical protein
MERRKFMIGVGSLAAGGAAATGTGAFASQEATRSVKVEVQNDENGAIQLTPTGDYASLGSSASQRVLSLKIQNQNDMAITEYGEQFNIRNEGGVEQPKNEEFETWITVESDLFDRNEGNAQNGGQPTTRIIAFDTDGGKQLNNVTNSKPANPLVLGEGESEDVELTINTRDLKNIRPSGSGSFQLVKSVTVHTERVGQ